MTTSTGKAPTLSLGLAQVGFATPGLASWRQACSILASGEPWLPTPLDKYRTSHLPANERRRTTTLIQLALRAADDCLENAALAQGDLAALPSVFASSGGDMGNLHNICEQLAKDPKGVSPTDFHNSVHNAVAGYFSIGRGIRAASVSLSAHDDSFVAGLLEAAALLNNNHHRCLLLCYDMETPTPLNAKRPVAPDVAVALLLTNDLDESHAWLRLQVIGPAGIGSPQESGIGTISPESYCHHPMAEAIRRHNPAGRVLPLLESLARSQANELWITTVWGALQMQVTPRSARG